MKTQQSLGLIVLLGSMFLSVAIDIRAQQGKDVRTGDVAAAILVDSWGKENGEGRSARFDNFISRLSNTPSSIGYVMIYCGKSCKNGEVEAHMRGIMLKTSHFDRSRLVILNSGFKDELTVELWLVPRSACPPAPASTVYMRQVKFVGSQKGSWIEPYDCCGIDFQQQWKELK